MRSNTSYMSAAVAKDKSGKKVQKNRLIVSSEAAIEILREGQTILQRVTTSKYYDMVSGVLIIANSIFIGVQTAFMASRAANRAEEGLEQVSALPNGYLAAQCIFAILFTIELCCRW